MNLLRRLSGVSVGVMSVAVLLAGCASGQPAGSPDEAQLPGKVEGKVYYLQRIALPAETKMVVQLLDVTDSTKPQVIATESRTVGMTTSLSFALTFNPKKVRSAGVYEVTAELRLPDGATWWHEQAYPVLTGGTPSYVEIRVYPKR